jgi:hypothetical protein
MIEYFPIMAASTQLDWPTCQFKIERCTGAFAAFAYGCTGAAKASLKTGLARAAGQGPPA